MRATWGILLLAACGTDPTLHVTVQHPAGTSVSSTDVSVYESPTLTCTQVEFGELGEEQLLAVRVAHETLFAVAPPQGDLNGLSRTDNKIIVARGYDAGGHLLAAGCAEKALVTGADQVTVTTQIAVRGSVDLLDATRMLDTYGLAVTVTDLAGHLVVDRPVSWTVYGPAGAAPASTAGLAPTTANASSWAPAQPSCTGADGVAQIHPVPPNVIGGYAVQPEVAWAASPVPQYSSITKIDLTGAAITPPATAGNRLCALGKTASGTVVGCLDGAGVTLFDVSVNQGVVTMTPRGSTIPVTSAVGVFSVPTGTDTAIYAMSSSGDIVAVYGATASKACTPASLGQCALTFDDLLVAPACGSSPARLLMHTSGNLVKWMDLAGGAVSPFPGVTAAESATLSNAGCTTELDPTSGATTLQQVIVVDVGITAIPSSRVHFGCSLTSCSSIALPVPQAGVGFVAAAQPYLVGTTIDATGVVLTSWQLEKNGTKDRFLEFARIPSAGIPHRIASGQLDTDGSPDLVWDSAKPSTIEIGYALQIGSQPLEAIAPLAANIIDLVVGDTDGDGFDDVLATARVGTRVSVSVLPSHVATASGPLMTDTPCQP